MRTNQILFKKLTHIVQKVIIMKHLVKFEFRTAVELLVDDADSKEDAIEFAMHNVDFDFQIKNQFYELENCIVTNVYRDDVEVIEIDE
jgi:hypothetical protein